MKTNRFPMLALAVAAAVAQAAATSPAHAQVQSDPSLEGFSLPPSDRRQPEAQGPVTEGVSRPRPAATSNPTTPPPPAIAVPAPAKPAANVAPQAPAPRAQATAAQPNAPRNAAPVAQVTPAAAPVAAAPATQAPLATPAPAAPTSTLPALPLPKVSNETASPKPTANDKGTSVKDSADTPLFRWGMLAALLAIFGIAIAIAWQRFVRSESRVTVPVIEPPRPRQRVEPENAPAPAPAAKTMLEQLDEEEDAEAALPLRCAFEVTRLSVTLMTATLSYRITLTNVSDRPFRDVSVGGDMVSAHSSLSMEQQMANAGEMLEIRHQVPAMLPGQSIFLSGDLVLPIRAIRAVRQGDAALFVPLARLKIEAEGLEMALLRTSLVGQRPAGPGAGLRPFRLDLGPRIYSEIGQRTLAVPA